MEHKPNKLDGSKKFTADLLALLVAAVSLFGPAFIPDLELAPILQGIGVIAPMVGAGIYHWKQGKQDVEKEKTKQAEAVKVTTEATRVIQEAEILKPLAEESYFEPFDQEAFAKKLEARAAKTYLEVTPTTVYFASLDKGKVTKCAHIDQALAYWDFLITRVRAAFNHMYGFPYEEAHRHLADDNKDCPYYSVENMARQKGIHFWNMLRQVRWVSGKQADLEALALTDIEWKAKLSPRDQTLLAVGTLAGELLKHNA